MPEEISRPIKRKTLLALPVRPWNSTSEYDFIYLCPTGQKHDSGYGLYAIIGANYVDNKIMAEIAGHCDDAMFNVCTNHPYKKHSTPNFGGRALRCDLEYPANIPRFWGSSENYFSCRFRVGPSLSSTEIFVFVEDKKTEKETVI